MTSSSRSSAASRGHRAEPAGPAAAVTAVTVVGLRHGLAPLAPSVRVVVPWLPLGAIALACVVIALLASLIPASRALRRAPLELAGGQE